MNKFENEELIEYITQEAKHDLAPHRILFNQLKDYIETDAQINKYVHSYKSREKEDSHLDEKITRKNKERRKEGLSAIDKDNIFHLITDIYGIRILHLHHKQFQFIHQFFMEKVNANEIALYEKPKAYGWDPEYRNFFEDLGIHYQQKESSYTSVHYVFQHIKNSKATCEIQVRTLCEELWGEIDHLINYPKKTEDPAVEELLKVFSKIVGASVKVSNSIFNIIEKK
ncbi:RelA/SpoT domain-containing protein [Actinobacillus genomosp. 1]|uniref:RelA/SpoT domain-containing protein n=1 Tax=Actinobacillus genomosp. 1 TaxID=254839 RepID=UPI0024420B95|nr:RelA/SpoT domain-containing protein [Actinobacillus genomosp. 1]WGE90721.1 RelA/SpoT domain-containing protein [Actinobacillus genomosp. 1]